MRSLTLLVNVSRPLGWVIAPLVFAIGLYYSNSEFSFLSIIQMILLSFPLSIILYGINDIHDYDSDSLNPRKNSIDLNETERALIKGVSILIAILLIASSIATLNLSNLLSMILLVSVSYFYSAPPIRLKEKPPLDSISNGILFFLAFSLGYSFGAEVREIPLKIYFVAICVMGIHSFGAVMDYTADKAAGQRTIATFFGKRVASIFSCTAFLSAYIFANIGREYINYYFVFCSLIFLIAAIYPSEKLASFLFKLIFLGFIITALFFVVPYLSS